LNDYEISDIATTPSPKKPTAIIAAFPPRQPIPSENHDRDTPTSNISNEIGIRFGTTPGPQIIPSVYEERSTISSRHFFSLEMMMIGMLKKVDNII
jgi:hypothetical protein